MPRSEDEASLPGELASMDEEACTVVVVAAAGGGDASAKFSVDETLSLVVGLGWQAKERNKETKNYYQHPSTFLEVRISSFIYETGDKTGYFPSRSSIDG